MKFTETPLKGAYVIALETQDDARGFFGRLYCKNVFKECGLDTNLVQINDSYSCCKGTLRGMHYQLPPKAETKIVRCIRGSLFDCIIDVRPESSTYLKHFGIELTAEARNMLYVPKGFAHGLMSLEDDTETIYLTTEFYSPEMERGIRYNDPSFKIEWPMEPRVVSDKDKAHLDFEGARVLT